MAAFKPSIYQQAVFDFVKSGSGSAIIDAVAGSGKTTTSVAATEFLDPKLQVLFLAFNKKIAEELQRRVPKHVKAATFHSVGFAAWRFFIRSVKAPDARKQWALLSEHFTKQESDHYGSFAVKLVSLAKGAGVGAILPDTEQTWFDLIDHFDLYLESDAPGVTVEEGVSIARRLLAKSIEAADNRQGSAIDFDDMLFMPLLRNVRFLQYDVIFVDEAQDTNAVQLALLRRMLKPGGRLIAVGDPYQAIYGFRGADSNAMDNIAREFGCQRLPLSISYRCAQAVVAHAKSIVTHLEASETAAAGSVEFLRRADCTPGKGDVMICRNTAPLIAEAYALLAKGIGCKVLGRELGAGLVNLINRMKARGLDQLQAKLQAYADREIARFTAKGLETKAEAVQDKVAAIMTVIEHLPENQRTVPALISRIETMFSDDANGGLLTLSTAHKSKGLEWDNVFILQPQLMPSKWARKDWQQTQEKNLMYVAWTRAKQRLVFMTE